MVLALSVEVDGERQVLARLEQINLLFQQQRIGAEVDVLLALHETGDNLVNLRMQQWLATRNRHRRCAALFESLEALLGRELHFQHVPGILDLSAASTRQIATEQRLQHQDERILLAPLQLLFEDVSCHRPGLRNRYGHAFSESPVVPLVARAQRAYRRRTLLAR